MKTWKRPWILFFMGKCFPVSHSFLDGIWEKTNKQTKRPKTTSISNRNIFLHVSLVMVETSFSVSIHNHLLVLTCQTKHCSKHYEEIHTQSWPLPSWRLHFRDFLSLRITSSSKWPADTVMKAQWEQIWGGQGHPGLWCLGRGREDLGGWREEKAVPCKSTLQIKSQDQENSQLGQRPVGRSADTEISADEAEGWLLPCSQG